MILLLVLIAFLSWLYWRTDDKYKVYQVPILSQTLFPSKNTGASLELVRPFPLRFGKRVAHDLADVSVG